MKAFALLIAVFLTAICSHADSTNFLARFSPYFSTDTKILWQVPTNRLPKSFWIYKRLPAQPFSASVISNAVMLASLQDKGFPKPSTNTFFIWSAPDPCGVRFDVFSIQPASGTSSFFVRAIFPNESPAPFTMSVQLDFLTNACLFQNVPEAASRWILFFIRLIKNQIEPTFGFHSIRKGMYQE